MTFRVVCRTSLGSLFNRDSLVCSLRRRWRSSASWRSVPTDGVAFTRRLGHLSFQPPFERISDPQILLSKEKNTPSDWRLRITSHNFGRFKSTYRPLTVAGFTAVDKH